MENISEKQIVNFDDKDEAIFVLEVYDQTPLSNVDTIVEKRWGGKFILYLSETEFLIRCNKSKLEEVLKRFKNKDLPDYYIRTVKSIRPLSLQDKISKELSVKLNESEDYFDVTGLLIPGFSEEKYDELINNLIKQVPNSKIKKTDFITSSLLTFNAFINKKAIFDIAKKPYVYQISEPVQVNLELNESIQIKNNLETKVDNSKNRPEICVIDSGVDKTALQNVIIIEDGHPTNNGNHLTTNPHGTEVSSIAAHGDELIFNNSTSNDNCNIISYKLADNNIGNPLFSCLYHACDKYKKRTRIFNLSVSFGRHNKLSKYLTNEIDKLVQKENVLLVNSAGNITISQLANIFNKGESYPFYLRKYVCQNPSNGKNVFSVSSFAYRDSSLSICKKNEISPFSALGRHPEIQDKRIKPNIFAFGGNVEKNKSILYSNSNLGLPVISINGLKKKRNGTSFSTPYISHLLSHLDQIYKPNNIETLKAILLSYSSPGKNHILKLFNKRNEICYSNNNRNIVLYAEGELGLKKWNKDLQKYIYEKNEIRFYVPVGVKEIRLVIVHSDSSEYSTNWINSTRLDVEIFKPGRDKKLKDRDSELWFFDKYSQIQYAVFKYQKAKTGDWYINILPESVFIRKNEWDNIKIRYGLAVNLILDKKTSKNTKPIQSIKEKLQL